MNNTFEILISIFNSILVIDGKEYKSLTKIDEIPDEECEHKKIRVQKKSLPNDYLQNDIEIGRATILKLERSKSRSNCDTNSRRNRFTSRTDQKYNEFR